MKCGEIRKILEAKSLDDLVAWHIEELTYHCKLCASDRGLIESRSGDAAFWLCGRCIVSHY